MVGGAPSVKRAYPFYRSSLQQSEETYPHFVLLVEFVAMLCLILIYTLDLSKPLLF